MDHQSQFDAKRTLFYRVQAPFLKYKIVSQRLIASYLTAPDFLAFDYVQLLLKIFKRLFE